jgi:D-alanyl-D-alanine dipeptidase
MPLRGDTYAFWLEAYREEPGVRNPGVSTEEAAFTREDLLGVTLNLSCTAEDDSSWLLRWDETKGERYLVQRMDGAEGTWQTVAEVPAGEERVFFTGHLPPFGEFRFRVSAEGGQVQPDGPCAVMPEEASASTAATLANAAAWSVTELGLYADAQRQEKIGVLPMDRAVCVLGEENGSLLVGTPAGSAYVDANYCMIDLPDYVGDLCEYRITNSVASIYMVHGVPMENMTGEIITGYEAVALPDGGYLAPLLYPTAQKLIAAALALEADGYRLRIYDSFRPHIATRAVYDQAMKLMEEPVSDEEDALTYRQLMTGDSYSLWDFLAAGISKHNRGIAVDVALVDIATGEELRMQSDIHDLSWHAATAYNDANAAMLAGYMRAAGFGTLFSEWWHFQDMETLNSLEPPYRSQGVTPEGWRRDDRGWRYRCADGSFLTGEAREIDGSVWSFGEDGYLLP